MYFFPNPFKSSDKFPDNLGKLSLTVNSGKNALRLALRSFNLSAGTKVGIPAFSCNAVYDAVKEENLEPYFFDLKNDNTYWADYNKYRIAQENVKAIIITHLYGFTHPNNMEIVDYCTKHDVKIIHDAAQSFGIDETLFANDVFVYSFSSGKSSTAAAGGEICNLRGFKFSLAKPNVYDKLRARLFFYSRYLNFKNKKLVKMLENLLKKLDTKQDRFSELSYFQKTKALQAKFLANNFLNERKERYLILEQAIEKNNEIEIAFNNQNGLYFKLVLFVENNAEQFLNYLANNTVPFYQLAKDINVSARGIESLSLFQKNRFKFVEISCERSIDLNEVKRVAKILADYK